MQLKVLQPTNYVFNLLTNLFSTEWWAAQKGNIRNTAWREGEEWLIVSGCIVKFDQQLEDVNGKLAAGSVVDG